MALEYDLSRADVFSSGVVLILALFNYAPTNFLLPPPYLRHFNRMGKEKGMREIKNPNRTQSKQTKKDRWDERRKREGQEEEYRK